MASGTIEIYTRSLQGALRQCELVSQLVQYIPHHGRETGAQVEFTRLNHPFAVIASQDCDLDWDHRARQSGDESHKRLPNILFCEVNTAESFRSFRGDVRSDMYRRIKNNKDERYQFLEAIPPQLDLSGEGIPELVVDFKRIFSLPADDVYDQVERNSALRRCRLVSPYAEHFTTRLFDFQSRIALPREHGQLATS